SLKKVGICLTSPRVPAPVAGSGVPSDPGPTIRQSRLRKEAPNRDENARGRGIAADRRGGRLVRVPRGDSRAVRRALSRGRALGLGAAPAADARNTGAQSEAPPGRGRGSVAAWGPDLEPAPGFQPPQSGFADRAR